MDGEVIVGIPAEVSVTFTARPMETAPKDRWIMICIPKDPIAQNTTRCQWEEGHWDDCKYHQNPKPYWAGHMTTERSGVKYMRDHQPIAWAEFREMEPIP